MKHVVLELPASTVEELLKEAREAGAAAARAVVEGRPAPVVVTPPVIRFARIRDYAKRVGLSPRSVHDLIAKGLPTIGAGRLRRVDVDAADVWLSHNLAP